MAEPTLNQICNDIKIYRKTVDQKHLYRNITFSDIPAEHLDILYSYLSINLICRLYGGNFKQQVKVFNARFQEKEDAAESLAEFVEYDPPGIGDHKYAERVKRKVIQKLEGIIDQSAATVSHNQFVQAAKALLEIASNMKLDAAEIMMAYESQLLILAEHLVENFLPELGRRIRKEFRAAEKSAIKRISELIKPKSTRLKIWSEEIDKIVRTFELKRYELMLAETMASNKAVSEAFDFTKDLLDNYRTTSEVSLESKSSSRLKKHIGNR